MVIDILYGTVLERQPDGQSSLVLLPFHSFLEAQEEPEVYRSMLMNALLFLPLGLTLPFALPERVRRKILITILFAAVFSLAIEITQLILRMGRCETDDVLMNTFGAALGTLSYQINVLWRRRSKKAWG